MACSFVYGGVAKSNNTNKTIKQENEPKEEHNNSEMETTPGNAAEPAAQQTPQSFSAQAMSRWPGSGSGSGRSLDSSRNLLTDIDLTRGWFQNEKHISLSSYLLPLPLVFWSSSSIQNVSAVHIFVVVDFTLRIYLEMLPRNFKIETDLWVLLLTLSNVTQPSLQVI